MTEYAGNMSVGMFGGTNRHALPDFGLSLIAPDEEEEEDLPFFKSQKYGSLLGNRSPVKMKDREVVDNRNNESVDASMDEVAVAEVLNDSGVNATEAVLAHIHRAEGNKENTDDNRSSIQAIPSLHIKMQSRPEDDAIDDQTSWKIQIPVPQGTGVFTLARTFDNDNESSSPPFSVRLI